jgi:hypothetical protein
VNYFGRWIEFAQIDKTYEGLLDLLVRDQLIQSCGRELTLFLKERKPKSIEEMADLADTFCDARGGNTLQVTQRSERSERSVQRPTRDDSRGRSFEGKVGFSKPKVPSSVPGKWPERRCFKCDSTDHLSFDCKKGKSHKAMAATSDEVPEDKYKHVRFGAREQSPFRRPRGGYQGKRSNSRDKPGDTHEAGFVVCSPVLAPV